MKTKLQYCPIILALLALTHHAAAQGTTAFTYQGQLREGGTNANGTYTMMFKLYDALTTGNLIGTPITNSPTLANGLFSVNLDFGNAFNGSARWLDITVQSGSDSEELTPRVQVLPAPYALSASSLNNSNWNVSAGSTGVGFSYNGSLRMGIAPTNIAVNVHSQSVNEGIIVYGLADIEGGALQLGSGGFINVMNGFIVVETGSISAPTINATSFYGNLYGSVQSPSDRNLKEQFSPIDNQEILEGVANLPICRWNYKADKTTPHLGPMAQDFYAAFNVGTDDKHIAILDEGGVALAAIQGLNEKLKAEDAQKDAQIKALEKRLSALEQLASAQK